MASYIYKRDGTTALYDSKKIIDAVEKAFSQTGETKPVPRVGEHIARNVEYRLANQDNVSVETIQDVVEQSLMGLGVFETAKHYILYRQQRSDFRKKYRIQLKNTTPVDTPWGEIGYITYKRTYSRKTDDGGQEEFEDTVMRVLRSCQTQLNVGFTTKELETARLLFLKLKCSVAGRFLWQLGTSTVDRIGLASTQNCAFVAIDDPVRPFTWAFDMLCLGAGVGFTVQNEYVSQLPPIFDKDITVTRQDTKDADFIVPDSREGWVKLLENTLEAFFIKGRSFTYSTILIRSKGTPIQGFGGVASGPEELCEGIAHIVGILRKRQGQKMRPIDCLDIMNIIGTIVVAGNVRRSAMLCVGDANDKEYLQAKRWDFGNIPNWRATSNNSVACKSVDELPSEFWEGYRGNGEPYGLINLELSRKVGRLMDGDKYPDPGVKGYNPCAEQSLCNFESCCLSEIFLPNIESYEELKTAAVILYRICKHTMTLESHHEETKTILDKNMRMGIGVSGYLMSTEEQKNWLPQLYTYLREYDVEYSKKHGLNPSIKLTTCKPSGTLSLLAGCTPGCHPAIFRYYIRRVRIAATNPLVELCKQHGYFVEYQRNFDGSRDYSTVVVEFPCRFPDHAVLAKDLSAIQQLEVVKRLQTEWSDNAVSVTVYYRLEELEDIKAWLKDNFSNGIKTCSFLLHHNHGFDQAPYEEITQEQYEELKSRTVPITTSSSLINSNIDGMVVALENDLDGSAECASGACPVR